MNLLLVLTLDLGVLGDRMSTANGACGPDLQSSFDIVKVLCQEGNHEEEVAHLIYGCYLGAQHKHLFIKCQRETFGNTMSSKAYIESFCRQVPQLDNYNDCLVKAFTDNGLTITDLIAQGTIINGCQGDITGTCGPTSPITTTVRPIINTTQPLRPMPPAGK